MTIPDRNAVTTYRMLYYPHNIHFVVHAAMMTGQRAVALAAADKLVAEIVAPMADVPELEEWAEFQLIVRLRFGMWDEVLAWPQPSDEQRFSTGFWHYARGVALARTGETDAAQKELDTLSAIVARPDMQEYVLWSLFPAAQMLAIAEHTLGGEVASARGDTAEMVAEFVTAIELNGELPYTEPPYWYVPPRQHYAAALLRAGMAAEAEAQYLIDLEELPKNGRAFFGLPEALKAQSRAAEADAAMQAFREAWSNADITLSVATL